MLQNRRIEGLTPSPLPDGSAARHHWGEMQYEEITPAEPLPKYIKCFWVMRSPVAELTSQERILPDGCTEIVFNLAEPFSQQDPDGKTRRQPLTLIVGQMRRHLLIAPTGRVQLVGVRFWPGGAYPFLSLPQDQIADRVIALDLVWGAMARELESRIREAPTTSAIVREIEAALLGRLSQFRAHDEAEVKAIALILRSGGCLPIERLAEKMGISFRKLDRRFNTRVGLPPKTLCRIIRFQRALRMIERENVRPDWVQIALECGYYDQPHFIKEFKAFAGTEPTTYFHEPAVMSDHFTQS
ncbi:MAG TPA: helix-turn-helix domain-containing protein [Blastocatellia bacterium]|nr:helix-turn-helix domain-containing protein [Blastocatellia bacterium]